MNITKIKEILPHRYPFLLIDKVLEINSNKNLTALKNVTANEEFFSGHFPAKPVMPGVLIIESMAQAAAIFAIESTDYYDINNHIIYLTSIENAHFRNPVIPGDSMIIHISYIKSRKNFWKIYGEAKVDDIKVADAVFSAMLIKKNS